MRPQHIVGCLVLMAATSAFGQTGCRAGWEYRVVDLSSPDALSLRKPQVVEARTSLEDVLNRLGQQGWEIASQNALMVYQEIGPNGATSSSVAGFDPPAVLFKRAIEVCK